MKRRRTKAEPLSRERVVDEAIRLADAGGLDALTMRGLASALGVQAMSLYHHVPHKDALLDLMVDGVITEVQPPSSERPWRQALRERATSLHAALVRHPWAPALIVSRVHTGPAMLDLVDATIGCLLAAGFSLAEADHAWNALDSYVYGFTLQQLHSPISPESYAEEAAAWLPTAPLAERPALAAMAEAVATGAHDGVNFLGFGLDLLLDGLERLRASKQAGAAPD